MATKTKAKKKVPVTDENFIVIPDNLGECPDDKVLILQDNAMQKSSGGIIIPDTAKEHPHTGIVIQAGERSDGKPNKYVQGDRVIFGQYAGVEISIKGTVYLQMMYRDILWNFKQ